MRKVLSQILKWLVIVSGLLGVFISFFTAGLDGYSPWCVRLLYFTTQSNIWIGVTMLLIVLMPHGKRKNDEKYKRALYTLKYIFSVSITVTGMVFCFLLAPFADESYRPWSLTSVMTHVLTPVFSVIDLFVDEEKIELNGKNVLATTIPPFCYFVFAVVLGLCNVDFGRGETYPYFFLNFHTEVGFFGFAGGDLPQMGSVYWIVLLLLLILSLGALYAKLHKVTHKK